MLFNCFSCGKKISSNKDLCVYCCSDNTNFIHELKSYNTKAENLRNPLATLKEKHAGTFFAFLLKK
ncbi:hypothetical protein CO046_03435 [Candidatus Peregrinibacteria bacterium CG_4_9_14_0_2_um_filter_53_11]|nr:MAG: hypothetical protein CO046_03435 [Candidatus Peregrinibacteria bacterium CG_4_9_14_0_2_um_filter_53_11]